MGYTDCIKEINLITIKGLSEDKMEEYINVMILVHSFKSSSPIEDYNICAFYKFLNKIKFKNPFCEKVRKGVIKILIKEKWETIIKCDSQLGEFVKLKINEYINIIL